MSIGDIVIVKKGRNAFLGYGEVISDYYFDDSVDQYKHRRKVNWKKKGLWNSEHKIVLKTLTDITNLPYIPNPSLLAPQAILNIINGPNSEEMKHLPLNQILYGPPGTGKTFSTIDIVVDINEPNNNFSRTEKKAKFDQLVNDGRAVFTTFHQSMSYEEFIEGIKPHTVNDQIRYEVTNGILKDIVEQCFEDIKALKAMSASGTTVLSFKEKFHEFSKAIQLGKIVLKTRSGIPVQLSKTSNAGNLQLNSGEVTRDYVISMKRLEKLVAAFPNPKVIKNIHEEIRSVIGGSNSSLYFSALDAFVSFDKKLTDTVQEDGKEMSLSEIVLTAEEIASLPPYFLIIDEINRGNVSAIFGELITLIEEDKRFGRNNQLFVTLPYSREEFILPPNLSIIGTMNTADRSVEALDTALRRRFSFVEMLPNPSKLEGKNIEGVDLRTLLETMNERIEVLVDRDHTIGHAFLINIESIDELRNAFANKIIPLLQEYFYGNYRKMEMVIGSAFFNITDANKVKFAVQSEDFDADGKMYQILNISNKDVMSDEAFIQALQKLMSPA
jgi:5-methylcytosine-specific restriction protein B